MTQVKVDSNDNYFQGLITLDNLAHRYGMLPSEVAARASTFDLTVIQAAVDWEAHQHRRAAGQNEPADAPGAGLSQAQLQAMIDQAKRQTQRKK